jgi:Clathrin adaptor complex small chain
MINAVLVFNNTGQPRLTKFYTQLVRFPPCIDLVSIEASAYEYVI